MELNYLKSSLDLKTKKMIHHYRKYLVLFLAEGVILTGFLLASQNTYRIGFPLDDAWIHQTYARNLGISYQWTYQLGQVSGGSTSPFWTFMLAAGYILHIGPVVWAMLLGGICLFFLSVFVEGTFRKIQPNYHPKIPWIGLMSLAEWHLAWSALSGMETILISLIIVLIFYLLAEPTPVAFLTGLMIGIAVWIRPDGLLLLGPAWMILLCKKDSWKEKYKQIIFNLAGFVVVFIPYLLFNQMASGAIWPNTFYAKQAEYADLMNQSLLFRFFQETGLPLIGVGAILAPGGIYAIIQAIQKRNIFILSAALWIVGTILIYAWRLPVVYQHGRYVIPVIPIWILICLFGLSEIRSIVQKHRLPRIFFRAWQISIPIVAVAFLIQGGAAYAMDTAVIESNMVDTAKWVNENTPTDSVIAVHDIGAMGYFSGRRLIDLAGLVNPEIISIIRNEGKLSDYLDQHSADYLVAFPNWYSELTRGKQVVFKSRDDFVRRYDQPPMTVYLWKELPYNN